ncbi:MAG: cytochrome c [Myxococcales bacterium]|nr:cytochrome c [Myxococcales bacterium]
MRSPKYPNESARWLVVVATTLGACRLDMHDAPYYEPLEPSALWDDNRSSRTPIPGTIARGEPVGDRVEFYTGRTPDGALVDELPEGVKLNEAFLAKGRERFEVFCSPCHGVTGYANGMIVQRGFLAPPSFHDDRLRQIPIGHFFDVITNGYGSMYSYAPKVRVHQRWAIAAYIRALQLSQDFAARDLTDAERAELMRATTAAEKTHDPSSDHGHGGGH